MRGEMTLYNTQTLCTISMCKYVNRGFLGTHFELGRVAFCVIDFGLESLRHGWQEWTMSQENQASQTVARPIDSWPAAITKLGRREGVNGVRISQFQK